MHAVKRTLPQKQTVDRLYGFRNKEKLYLGLNMAAGLVSVLEQLTSALQTKSAIVSWLVEAVKIASTHISAQRKDEVFHDLFFAAEEKCEGYQLNP